MGREMRAGAFAYKVLRAVAALGKATLVIIAFGFVIAVLAGGVRSAFTQTLEIAFEYPFLGGLMVVGALAIWIERNPDLLERDGMGVLVGLAVLGFVAAWWFGSSLCNWRSRSAGHHRCGLGSGDVHEC